ncbi:putative fasciclin-like arabinogalactan protein 20 [Nymphaea colorata]|uniref:putative fasciclin-like arabinogalactan protein 20 n=1 Tax=Nymphaea colorata TaxID=210225 RepID=UPI00129D5F61|nr:putative fasciclin-like arabinogalactan protein 20 [Nymphaea colorata]
MADSSSSSFFSTLLLLSFIFCCSSVQDPRLEPLHEALIVSGYSSMSLTLQLAPETLIPNASATIFAASDSAFFFSGQPSLLLLRYHVSPRRLSSEELISLPSGTHISTLLSDRFLVVTGNSTINGVPVAAFAPIYRDAGFVAYGVERFLNPSFPTCPLFGTRQDSVFQRSTEAMASRGFGIFASLLDLQIIGLMGKELGVKLTVFAVPDMAMEGVAANLTELAGVLRRHVVPCKVSWVDIEAFGGVFPTLDKRFPVNLTRSGVQLEANGVPIVFPDLYPGNSIVVHGLLGAFPIAPAPAEEVTDLHFDGPDL